MNFFVKHPRFWGGLSVAAALIASNIGSAWAGTVYKAMVLAPPGENSAPPNVGFQIVGWTVYPLALVLLALGLYLISRRSRP